MKYTIQLLVLCLLLISINVQAQYYSFEEVPEWVNKVEIPTNIIATNKYDISAGFYMSLLDLQSNMKTEEKYFHQVLNVVSYSGITNASQISIPFDSSYQKLIIHSLYIWRKGEKIDYTKELTIELINKETKLHQGIYSGIITAYDILNDVRKGDLIDFAYTTLGSNPIFNKEKFGLYPLEFSSQIDALYYRFLLPKDKKYNYKFVNCDSNLYSDSITGDYREIVIKDDNIEITEYDKVMPPWSMPSSYFSISSLDSWREVNIWAQGVFKLDTVPNLDDVFKEVLIGGESQEQKINKIIKYVQDDIRYMGIESGIGSIKPFAPEKVVNQRFGDCKDKSLLLVSLLKQIGVKEAYPVLVSTVYQDKLKDFYSAGHIFNHCITMFKIDTVEYWIDPTISLQGGGFKNRYCPNYEKALIVGIPSDSLQNMKDSKVLSETFTVENIVVESFNMPTKINTVSTRYGKDADNRRMMLEYVSIDKLSKSIIDEMKKIYPKIEETEDVIISDDIVDNKLTMTYTYEVGDNWHEGSLMGEEFSDYVFTTFRPQIMNQYFSKNVCNVRKYDMPLAYPINVKYRVIFTYPKELLLYDDYEEIENDAFFFSKRIEQLTRGSFQVDYEFRTKANSIKAKNYVSICNEINEISQKLYMLIYFEK